MPMIITDRPSLLTVLMVDEIMTVWRDRDGYVISDAAAMTIASWWQAPSGHGATLAELASTGRADQNAVISAGEYERGWAMSGSQDDELCALIKWAENMCKLCGHIVRPREGYRDLGSESDGVLCPTTTGEITGHQI